MTRERAIDLCQAIDKYLCAGNPIWDVEEIHDAMSMAIEALKEQRPLLKISKTVNREELENIIKNSPMMLITPDTEKIELIREQQWIPCSERLPEMPEDYLVCDNRNNIFVNFFSTTVHHWSNGDSLIVAWMPLPEPYKAESEE